MLVWIFRLWIVSSIFEMCSSGDFFMAVWSVFFPYLCVLGGLTLFYVTFLCVQLVLKGCFWLQKQTLIYYVSPASIFNGCHCLSLFS